MPLSIETVLEEIFLRYGIESIATEVFRLQDHLLGAIDTNRIRPLTLTPHFYQTDEEIERAADALNRLA